MGSNNFLVKGAVGIRFVPGIIGLTWTKVTTICLRTPQKNIRYKNPYITLIRKNLFNLFRWLLYEQLPGKGPMGPIPLEPYMTLVGARVTPSCKP